MAKYERVTRSKLDIPWILSQTRDEKSGGTVVFIGTIRDNSEAGNVDKIDYDAYVPMAEKRMLEIEDEINRRLPVGKFMMQHRIGELGVGDVSVVISVSAPHRAQAFELCRYGIEEIKRVVPIWKKERLADGREKWVEGKVPVKADAEPAGATKGKRAGPRKK
ncbi:MAG: molybdenum cofactor biosynthesis protein MoaE [Nitrososphaerales archaeon]